MSQHPSKTPMSSGPTHLCIPPCEDTAVENLVELQCSCNFPPVPPHPRWVFTSREVHPFRCSFPRQSFPRLHGPSCHTFHEPRRCPQNCSTCVCQTSFCLLPLDSRCYPLDLTRPSVHLFWKYYPQTRCCRWSSNPCPLLLDMSFRSWNSFGVSCS